MKSKILQPVSFIVQSIRNGDREGILNINIQFLSNEKEYSYYRKATEDGDNMFVIIDGCKVTINKNLEVVDIERVYETKGYRRSSTEGQVKAKRSKRKSNIEKAKSKDIPNPVQDSECIIIEVPGDGDEDEDDIHWGDPVDLKFDSESTKLPTDSDEQEEWDRIEKEEQAEKEAQRKKEELEKLKGEIHHEKYDQIKTCLECGIPVYLAGPAGSGKNYTLEQIANELGWNFYFSNSIQQEYKLTGFIDAGGKFHETEFYKACTDENECMFFLDEIDASIPDVLVLLNAAIANGYFEFPNGRVDFDHVHFVAAGNTVGSGADDMYTGRMVLDQATLDRFAIIEFDYCELIEKKLTNNNEELIAFTHDLRKTANESGIRATFSYRCLMMVTRLEEAGMPLEDIMSIAIMRGLDKDTINTFSVFRDTESKYYKALQNLKLKM